MKKYMCWIIGICLALLPFTAYATGLASVSSAEATSQPAAEEDNEIDYKALVEAVLHEIGEEHVTNIVYVVVKEGYDKYEIIHQVAPNAVQLREFDLIDAVKLEFPSSEQALAAVRAFNKLDSVKYAEPKYDIPYSQPSRPMEEPPTIDEGKPLTSPIEAAEILGQCGLLRGKENDFALDDPLTRAEGAVLLGRLQGMDEGVSIQESPFVDVPAEHWAAPAIACCADAGLVNGVGDGAFAPDTPLTAPQFVTMLLRLKGYQHAGPEDAMDMAISVQMLDEEARQWLDNRRFERKEMVCCLYWGITSADADGTTLLDKLVARGVDMALRSWELAELEYR